MGGRHVSPPAKGRGLLSAAPLLLVIGLWSNGCVEWLEVDDSDSVRASLEARAALRAEAPPIPSQPPAAGGDCLLLPNTPGLWVPEGVGYWTRARLEALDVLLPCSLVTFHRYGDTLHVRFEAASDMSREGRAVRLVTSLRLPGAATIEDLTRVDLKPLPTDTTAAFRTSTNDAWTLTIERLTFETVTGEVVAGSFEGTARRGIGGQRERRFEVGFVAMRSPDASAPEPVFAVPVIPEPAPQR